jgi:hypothetical protein
MPDRAGDRASNIGRPALSRCVALPYTEFAESAWGRRAVLTRAAELRNDRGFEDLLTLAAVDELLSRRGLRTPFLRLAKNGTVVPSAKFTRPGGAGAEIGDQVADDKVLALFADGATIVLQALHRVWPPVIDFAGELGVELGHPVQVNAYITPPQSQGFASHYDVHDVFVLQVAGRKRWRIHAPVHPLPLRDQPWTDHREAVAAAAAGDPVIDTVLEPGDTLYLPRGYLHAAEALGDVCAHLTVGVHAVTRYALAQTLLALVADDERLRESLPLGVDLADPKALAEPLAAAVEALTERLTAIAPEDVAARLRAGTWPRSRPAPIAPLAQSGAAADAGPQTVLRWRPGLRAALREEADRLTVDHGDSTVTLAPAAAPAVKALLAGQDLAIRDLPRLTGLTDPAATELARTLLRRALVVPVDPIDSA